MKNYAIVENGIVTNIVVWDGDESSGWQPPDGAAAVPIPQGQSAYIGLGYADGIFEQPPLPAPPAFSELRDNYFNTQVRPTRERILNRLTGIGLAAQASGDDNMVAAVISARQSLLDITQVTDVVAATDMPTLRAAVVLAYHAVIDATPDELKDAFNGVDL